MVFFHAHYLRKSSPASTTTFNCTHGDLQIDSLAWANAVPIVNARFSALSPAPADHLLLLLAHGSRWNPVSSVRWVADAVTLLRNGEAVCWTAFVAAARARRLTLPAAAML